MLFRQYRRRRMRRLSFLCLRRGLGYTGQSRTDALARTRQGGALRRFPVGVPARRTGRLLYSLAAVSGEISRLAAAAVSGVLPVGHTFCRS